ncbi:recombinase family protein [Streptomyces sp. NPDC006997]|uniref:recombinase family protein n=1 Tax=Streptomyces sp. NPDC006997 TaxID=3155356 RepID=UPI0033CF66C5
MVSKRSEGDLQRRRALADAAAGVVQRFRCVIYLCAAPNTNIAVPREECTEYAQAFGWEITEVIEERAGLLPPRGRAGLERALGYVSSGEAGAVLTAWRSMISSLPQEYDEVAREIEKSGGFLHVKHSARTEQRAPL